MAKIIEVDPELMKLNPFAQSFRIPVSRVTDKRYSLQKNKEEPISYDYETTQSVRIFYTPTEHEGNKEIPGTLKTIAKLSPAAKNMLMYVLTHLESGQDWIKINRPYFMKQYSVGSINTVKRAEKELCVSCLLNRCELYTGVFWINPKFFYSGSRSKNFPANVDIKKVTNK